MVVSLSTPQQALDARSTDPHLTVYIGGVIVPVTGYSGQHRAGQTATATLSMPLPLPASLSANADLTVHGGHNDLVGTIFSGYIPEWELSMTGRGDELEVQAVGWSRRLTEPFRTDLTFKGPVRADAVFVALCQRAGIPAYIAETPTFPNGQTLTLGGNSRIDEGKITIRANSSPLSQFQRLVRPYAYDVSDTLPGPVILHRILGEPAETAVVTFREGTHLMDTYRTYDVRGVVNVHDINGQTYEDAYGASVPIRSFAEPDSVPANPEIIGGYRYEHVQNSDIVRADQAEAVRAVAEITHNAAHTPVRWDSVAVPGLSPGDVVAVESETVGASGRYWIVGVDISSDDSGFTATYDAITGTGETYPAGIDRDTIVIQTGTWHGGDETVSHYDHPAPEGTSKTWNITIPADASAVNVRGYAHSWNSQTVAGDDTELEVSKWQVWEPGSDYDDDQPEASGTMPQMAERYYQRPDFTAFTVASGKQPGDDGYVTDPGEWAPFAINLGRLDAGDYVLRFACGQKAGYDDGEVRAVYIEHYGLTEAAGYEEGS